MRDVYGKDCTLGPYASDGWNYHMTQAAPGMVDAAEGGEDKEGKIRGKNKRVVYHTVDPRLLWLALDDLEVPEGDAAVKANQKEAEKWNKKGHLQCPACDHQAFAVTEKIALRNHVMDQHADLLPSTYGQQTENAAP